MRHLEKNANGMVLIAWRGVVGVIIQKTVVQANLDAPGHPGQVLDGAKKCSVGIGILITGEVNQHVREMRPLMDWIVIGEKDGVGIQADGAREIIQVFHVQVKQLKKHAQIHIIAGGIIMIGITSAQEVLVRSLIGQVLTLVRGALMNGIQDVIFSTIIKQNVEEFWDVNILIINVMIIMKVI